MLKNKSIKRAIYRRTFLVLFAIYFFLMGGFSIFMLRQESKIQELQLRTFSSQVNTRVGEVLQEHMNSDNRIDMAGLKKEFAKESPLFSSEDTEVAVYTGDHDLIFNTNDDWLCSYSYQLSANRSLAAYGFLNPEDWFDEKEIKELEQYLYAQPKAKEVGDLTDYSIDLDGFWVDEDIIIPDKITVTSMFADTFDEYGTVIKSTGYPDDAMVYASGYEDKKGLSYVESGNIRPPINGDTEDETRRELRELVTDQEKLQGSVLQAGIISHEWVNPVTYRYYVVMPYKNYIQVKSDDPLIYYSEAWTVVARQVNFLQQRAAPLTFMWISCFITFLAAAFILSVQTYKTYRQREELESRRKETTRALAHDLKTPLTIISGYAQNLIENVHTEKRMYYAENIKTNVSRMDKILQEMLELSKLESESFSMKWEEVSLGDVCRGLISRYGLICEEKSISVSLEGDEKIKADFSLMERVIDNFFINALAYTPDGGLIKMMISDGTFEFYNSGSHIPEDKIKEIWKPYRMADESRSNTNGSGLGLAISSTILDLYQFSYGTENKSGGVVFWFKFI
ncbi:sensor histidine kinase [Clostridium aminobutyricum]|uniref:histidine kinase n=1 Tax=Clostridium aminobutyricum TaxID=33953 RepID=A0A939IHS0_CLOAM|nr:HAMP domain-containing sensor histidine kinase [Clostridium aminobutyricum]MBN7771749.1 HAMP domain-containing histidine kinase [Clostridium aminobutyricum]